MINPIDKAVGLRLRARRIEIGLAQEAVASALHISFQQLQKYESGKNRIAASRIYALAQILKVTPSYFFEVGEVQSGPVPVDPAELVSRSDEGKQLNEAFRKIKSRRLRQSIIDLIENIAANTPDAGSPRSNAAKQSAVGRKIGASKRSDGAKA